MSEGKPNEPDWRLPFWQNLPESLAILRFLRDLTADFRLIDHQLTDADWTAFRALAKKGGVEGILRLGFTDPQGKRRVIHYLVQGDYIPAMPQTPIMDVDHPSEITLSQARLTGLGELWAGYLRREADHPEASRCLVLTLFWQALIRHGSATRTIPKRSGGIYASGNPTYETSQAKTAQAGLGSSMDSPGGVHTHPPTEPILNERQEEFLEALLELEAFDRHSRKSTKNVAEKAAGPEVDPAVFKEPAAALQKRGLIETQTGRRGGCWLTAEGKATAIKIRER